MTVIGQFFQINIVSQTKFANFSALFPQVQNNVGQENWIMAAVAVVVAAVASTKTMAAGMLAEAAAMVKGKDKGAGVMAVTTMAVKAATRARVAAKAVANAAVLMTGATAATAV